MNIIIEEIVTNPVIQIEETVEVFIIEVTEMQVPGTTGDTGAKGDDGATGATGATGKSAYQSALDGGFIGTELEFNTFLSEVDKLDNLSGINTGDETASTIINKIGDGSKINQSYLPSYVDDILEYDTVSLFPLIGEMGKIYIAIDSNKQYRWTGSLYTQITNGLIASTNDVPEGINNLYFTVARFLANLTATNIKNALGITTLSGSNTGDQDLNGKEDIVNKQNSLNLDGSGVKYPTIDAINNLSWLDKMKRGIQFFTDFEGSGTSQPYLNTFILGSGATTFRTLATVPNQQLNQIGFCQYQTGTTSSGYATHFSEGNVGVQFQVGGGSWIYESSIEIQNLSTILERFRFISGFGTSTNQNNDGSGIFFIYDDGGVSNGTTASPYWQCVTSNNNVRTLTTTTVLVNELFNTLRIEVNAAGTSVVFKINGNIVATHTTNIPTGVSRFNVKQGIVKSIGITNRSVFCDYLGYENYLTIPRP